MVSDRIPEKQEVLDYFDEQIGLYQGLKEMYLAEELNVYKDLKGVFIYKPKAGVQP